MITSFAVVNNNKRFRFVATCTNKYVKGATPKYNYACNNTTISEVDYMRNLEGFKQSRK